MLKRSLVLFVSSFTLAGCSSAGGTVHCNVSVAGSAPVLCLDYTGLTADQEALYERNCAAIADAGANSDASTAPRATWTRSGCSRIGAIGGCRQQSGSFATTAWYYGSIADGGATTVDSYRSSCTMIGGVWVDP